MNINKQINIMYSDISIRQCRMRNLVARLFYANDIEEASDDFLTLPYGGSGRQQCSRSSAIKSQRGAPMRQKQPKLCNDPCCNCYISSNHFKPERPLLSLEQIILLLWTLLLLSAGGVFPLSYHNHILRWNSNTNQQTEDVVILRRKMEEKTMQVEKLQQVVETLRRELLQSMYEKSIYEKQRNRAMGRENELAKHIQEFSKEKLLAKYGPGPHHVEIQLDFAPNSNVQNDEDADDSFIIELAPYEEMPHTVYWFLEQVEQHIYDGFSFHVNAPHIMQAAPSAASWNANQHKHHLQSTEAITSAATNQQQQHRHNRQSSTAARTGTSSSASISNSFTHRLLGSEYSPNFPHLQYTLGFPSGGAAWENNFYISMKDNSIGHGPGEMIGNPEKAADPCFAKVIQGFETVDKMHKSPLLDDGGVFMKNPVAIRTMKIV